MFVNETNDLGLFMLRSAPERYEEFVIAAFIADEDMWTRMRGCVCVRAQHGTEIEVNDFTAKERYWLFIAVRNYRKALGKFGVINDEAVMLGLRFAAAQGKDVPLEGKPLADVMELFHKLSVITAENARAVINGTWVTWITYAQLNYAMTDLRRGGFNGDIMSKADRLARIKSDIATAANLEEDVVSSVDDIWILDEENTERIPLGRTFKALSEITGGGPGKGEHILAVVPTGGGKTTLACQLGAEIAASGRHVLLISTEQHARQLIPRMVSCLSYNMALNAYDRILSKPIKDGITTSKLESFSAGQRDIHNRIHDAIGPYMHIASWNSKSYTIADIPAMIEKENAKLEDSSLDMVILDWIGGAIVKGETDSNKKRLVLYSAAEQMHTVAEQYNVACMSTCQTNEKGKHVWEVTSEHIADCKNLPDTAEVAFGISCMPASPEKDLSADGESTYSKKQRLTCFKSRKAEAIKTDIERNFAYQRFNQL